MVQGHGGELPLSPRRPAGVVACALNDGPAGGDLRLKGLRCRFTERALVNSQIFSGEAAEDHFVNSGGFENLLAHAGNGYLRRKSHRVAVNTRTDAREGDRANTSFCGQLYRAAIAAGQQFWFSMVTTSPHRPHRVNDVLCRKAVALGDLGFPGFAATQEPAFVYQLRSGRPVNRAINATTTEQRRVGGIDDGFDGQLCDVGPDCAQSCLHVLWRSWWKDQPRLLANTLAAESRRATGSLNSRVSEFHRDEIFSSSANSRSAVAVSPIA